MNIETLRKLAGLPLMESAPVSFNKFGMSEVDKTLASIGRILMDRAETESDDGLANELAKLGNGLAEGDIADSAALISAVKDTGDYTKQVADALKSAFAEVQGSVTEADAYNPDDDGLERELNRAPKDAEDSDYFDQVDLSDMYDNEVEESSKSAKSDEAFMSVVWDALETAEKYAHGGVTNDEFDQAYLYFNNGDFEDAAETLLQSFTDQDGGEVYEIEGVFFELVDDLRELSTANESIGAPQREAEPVEDWEEDLIDPATGEYYDSEEDQEVEEAVQSTTNNAMQSALDELRKLAGL